MADKIIKSMDGSHFDYFYLYVTCAGAGQFELTDGSKLAVDSLIFATGLFKTNTGTGIA